MATTDDTILGQAFGLYQQRRFAEAERLFKSLLARNPNNSDALHFYGLLKVATGDFQRADELVAASLRNKTKFVPYSENYANVLFQAGQFDRALRVCADAMRSAGVSEALQHLSALALYRLGRWDEAAKAYDGLLRMLPRHFAAHNEKSAVLAEQGRYEEALVHVQKALELSPSYSPALLNMGNILAHLDRHDDAIAAYGRALSIEPGLVFAWLGRGNVLKTLGRHDEALACYDKALSIRPDLAEAWIARGNAFWSLRRYDEALAAYDKALSIRPGLTDAWLGRGAVFTDLKRYDEALAAYDKGLSIGPDSAEGWIGRGTVLFGLNRDLDALECFDRALALKPDYPEAQWNKGLVKLALGEYADGWRLYEARRSTKDFTPSLKRPAQPLWLNDSDIAGKTLLVHAEQGLGDTVHFCRYVDRLGERAGKIVLQVQEPLVPLLKAQNWNCDVVAEGQEPPPFDVHCSLLSLPLAFGTRVETIPAAVPYIRVPPAKESEWSGRLGPRTKPRIGLVWSGNPHFARGNDVSRPVPLAVLSSIMSDRFEWYRLQRDLRASDREAFDALSFVKDFSRIEVIDTAALMTQLDLVISIDTFHAHLAGALGKPVWVLLAFHADFRWLRERTDSPWYPTARLYRQTRAADWTDVLDRVSADLKTLLPDAT